MDFYLYSCQIVKQLNRVMYPDSITGHFQKLFMEVIS